MNSSRLEPVPGEHLSTGLGVVAAAMLVALLMTGCDDGGVTGPPARLTLTTVPKTAETGEPVTFTFTGSSSAGPISISRIDFEDDGSWDDSHAHNSSAISTTFTHTYKTVGSYTALVEILEGDQSLGTTSATVRVIPTYQREVYLTLASGITVTPGRVCQADGPPAAEPGQTVDVFGSPGSPRLLGWFDRGATIDLTQHFVQRYDQDRGRPGVCHFEMRLLKRDPVFTARMHEFASGGCLTSADVPAPPGTYQCSVTIHKVVY